jgi:hypothetical protein
MGATMKRISVNGVELEFESAGLGEAVVLSTAWVSRILFSPR